VAARLARVVDLPSGVRVVTVWNDGEVEAGVAAVVGVLRKEAVAF
jgi:hypothetical protein